MHKVLPPNHGAAVPPAGPPQVLRMPLRLVEARYGSGNFDDAGDDIAAVLAGLAAWPGQLRVSIEFDCAHPNPWYHAMVYGCEALPEAVYAQLRAAVDGLGLLDP